MKVSKVQAQENRAHIVATASRLFRERGYDGIGVADLMAEAGFTHGGFYKHFASKADLMAEAATAGMRQSAEKTHGLSPAQHVRQYLSRDHRDAPGEGCTMAALSGDVARQSPEVKARFAQGIEDVLQAAAHAQGLQDKPVADVQQARARQLAVMAQMVGALVLSRACPDDSPLADDILEACREAILSHKR